MTAPSDRPTATGLARRLGLFDAVVVGAGSMIGAGVFSAWGPAANAAGAGLLFGLVIAAVVALCNATSSTQLAAVHPESGGTYVFARRQLAPSWGHLAGWSFIVGKTASCVALALTAGEYLWPDHARPVAIIAVALVAVVNIGGLSRTVAVTKCLLIVAITALAAVIVAGWSASTTSLSRITPIDTTVGGTLRSAGFLFFAFAGYARIATLGEEVRDPAVTIPRAIPRALGVVLVIYAAVGVTLLATVPVDTIAASDAPLDLVVDASRFDLLSPVVRIGAGIAALGVLLNLIPGISRTVLAMARRHELPHWFAAVDERRSIPLRAEAAITVVVIALTATVDLRGAIGFSGVTILTYYAITNAASLTLQAHERRWPRSVAIIGIAGCLILAVALPLAAILTGTAVLVVGVTVGRFTRNKAEPGRPIRRRRGRRVRDRG
ncbi:MAG: APC family permease [Ilumatobacteraceae bacterium]